MSLLRNILIRRHNGKLPDGALHAACVLVCRSGLAPFEPGEDPTLAEVEALARAREEITKEHLALLVFFMQRPSAAIKPFDGGNAERAEVLAQAWAMVGM